MFTVLSPKTDWRKKKKRVDLSEDMWKSRRIKKSLSNHEFFSEHWIKQRERVGASGSGGGWPQSCPNERVRCWMLGEADERGEGDREVVGHQSPLPSPSRPAALPRSAHVSESSNAGPTAARYANTKVHTWSEKCIQSTRRNGCACVRRNHTQSHVLGNQEVLNYKIKSSSKN